MDQIVQIFKALSDETRLKILIILSRRSICAKGIAQHLNISEAAVSQHIKLLKEAGILVGEKTGYYVRYNLLASGFTEMMQFIEELHSDHTITECKADFDSPIDCKSTCKANNKKCCHQ